MPPRLQNPGIAQILNFNGGVYAQYPSQFAHPAACLQRALRPLGTAPELFSGHPSPVGKRQPADLMHVPAGTTTAGLGVLGVVEDVPFK